MRCCGCCVESAECAYSVMRILENLPGIGHLVAAVYGCMGQRAKAERALIKASVGICFCACQLPAEALDESSRNRSPKLWSPALMPRSTWMAEFQNHRIKDICLPGSHQSGGFKVEKKLAPIPLTTGWTKCQELSITEQLIGGVRFFDFRVMNNTDGRDRPLMLHHNVVVFAKFTEALEAIRDFIKLNATEVVGFYVTNDGQVLNRDKLNGDIEKIIGKHVYTGDAFDATIGQIVNSGKNIIVFGDDVAYGQRLNYRWPNKTKPDEVKDDLQQHIIERSRVARYSFFWYKAECTPDATMVVRNLGGVPGLIAAKCAAGKFEFIEGLATTVNYGVFEVLEKASQLPFNVLSTDYVTDDVVGRIIDMNRSISGSAAQMASSPEGAFQNDVTSGEGGIPGQTGGVIHESAM